jgi:hypothetical protein
VFDASQKLPEGHVVVNVTLLWSRALLLASSAFMDLSALTFRKSACTVKIFKVYYTLNGYVAFWCQLSWLILYSCSSFCHAASKAVSGLFRSV